MKHPIPTVPENSQPKEMRFFSAALLPLLLCSAALPLAATKGLEPPAEPPIESPIGHLIEICSTDGLAAGAGGIDAQQIADLSRSVAPFEAKLRSGLAAPGDLESLLELTYEDVVILRNDDVFEYIVVWRDGLPYERCIKRLDMIIDDPSLGFPAKISVETFMTLP